MAKAKNILFIMFDQLRWDYLGCYGHPHLHTPNIDRLASMGVRFDRAYIQSPICGSSRMCFYTGRYAHSHGATWNTVPLKVGEQTLGDHLRKAGMGCWLVGKTHMEPDLEGMERLGLSRDTIIGARVAECGFDVFERDDGMRPEGPAGLYDPGGALKYSEYLSEKGYDSDNPWHDFANSGLDEDGNVLSGWFLRNSLLQANIAEDDSETPYLTRRGMAFMEQAGDEPWCMHLSYIKPHWPYIVPAPYHDMYGPEHVQAAQRSKAERENAHPVMDAFMKSRVSQAFARDEVRDAVIPVYMGLIKQIDDQMGVLFKWLEDTGRMDDTMIVLTSDHGDFLGDHWLGEKSFFYESSIRVPLIIYDPSPEADATRGTACDALVESIDLAPTFLDLAGGEPADHILEGESLLPILHGQKPDTEREAVFCEVDFTTNNEAVLLGASPDEAMVFMVATRRWKLIHFETGHRPMLFDLQTDPEELVDLGALPEHGDTIRKMYDLLGAWARRLSQRTTVSKKRLEEIRAEKADTGVMIGVWDENDVPARLTAKYTGRRARDMRQAE
ncbi:alkaline phosphatase family protein [Ruegeria arenilitoris]|uniref:alkaline phosphatase family protein n=1 Tax=Ruegeria arenilitoris TaxID=1173585 RepID=UPI00147E49A3|nr:alkaline phosphatase family protein [Ruegeria arenilitoris]